MPILEVEIVGDPKSDTEGLARRLADAAGLALGSGPHGTWVRLRYLPADQYAENGGLIAGTLPVFVNLILADPPAGAELARVLGELTDAIAAGAGRPPENVHIAVEPGARGRIAFGGKLVQPEN